MPARPLHVCRVGAAVALISVAASCSREPVRSVSSFCRRLAVEQGLLTTKLTDPVQVGPLLDRFHALDARAPEQIRDDWHAVTVLVDRVAAADVRSTETQTDLVKLALATDQNVNAVIAYSSKTCGVDLTATTVPTTVPPVTEPSDPPST